RGRPRSRVNGAVAPGTRHEHEGGPGRSGRRRWWSRPPRSRSPCGGTPGARPAEELLQNRSTRGAGVAADEARGDGGEPVAAGPNPAGRGAVADEPAEPGVNGPGLVNPTARQTSVTGRSPARSSAFARSIPCAAGTGGASRRTRPGTSG